VIDYRRVVIGLFGRLIGWFHEIEAGAVFGNVALQTGIGTGVQSA
jgi:hypothetical protein